jgi:hypothetical protein
MLSGGRRYGRRRPGEGPVCSSLAEEGRGPNPLGEAGGTYAGFGFRGRDFGYPIDRQTGRDRLPSMGFREERVAQNEATAREVNEAIQEFNTRPTNSFIHVACECGMEDCERVLTIRRPEYERVRSDPRQFVILPPHLISEVEDVVVKREEFFVVAKRRGTAEDIAVRTDPRR